MEIKYIDRETGTLRTESVMGDGALRFAYETLAGRMLWPLLFSSRMISAMLGRYYDSRLSHRSIPSLAATPGLRADEAEKPWQEYSTFNDFFTRRLKPDARPVAPGADVLCAPADGRLKLYTGIARDAKIPVKGAVRSLETLCGRELPDARYDVAVVRLAPVAREKSQAKRYRCWRAWEPLMRHQEQLPQVPAGNWLLVTRQ